MPHQNNAKWPAAEEDTFRELVAKGMSAGQAALVMGISRNAAIGKARRLGLKWGGGIPTLPCVNPFGRVGVAKATLIAAAAARPKREPAPRCPTPKPVKAAKAAAKAAASAPPAAPKSAPNVVAFPPPAPTGPGVAMMDRERHECAWPLDPINGEAMCCGAAGAPTRRGGPVYCDHHAARARAPVQQDQRRAGQSPGGRMSEDQDIADSVVAREVTSWPRQRAMARALFRAAVVTIAALEGDQAAAEACFARWRRHQALASPRPCRR